MSEPATKSRTSWFTRIVLGLIIVAMAGFGLANFSFDAVRGDQVIKAGDRTVDSRDFRREFDRYKKRAEERAGQPLTPEIAEQNKLDTLVLNDLATRQAFSELLRKIGIRPSDKLVADEIGKIPDFFDPITGKFDKTTFEKSLSRNN